jgi:hypothetical protein
MRSAWPSPRATRTVTYALLAMVIVAPTAAETRTSGREWLGWCNEEAKDRVKRAVEYGGCLGYVNGLRDGLDAWMVDRKTKGRICIPWQVDTFQLVDVGKRYINARPESRHEDAATLLGMAFFEAWPCK